MGTCLVEAILLAVENARDREITFADGKDMITRVRHAVVFVRVLSEDGLKDVPLVYTARGSDVMFENGITDQFFTLARVQALGELELLLPERQAL
jgi:hypothetical protein